MLNHPQGIQPMPFDPPGGVLTTDRLDAYMDEGKPMLNNYTRYAKIGDGQHGEVYLCYRTDTKYPPGHPCRRTMVAMKSVKRNNLRAEQMKRLRKQRYPNSPHVPLVDNLNTTEAKIRKEIAIMKKCRHPHVVRLFEVIDDRMKDKIYMVIEYLGGGEVKWRNEHELPVLTLSQTRRILRDAVLGLEYLHHQGIIHRDIKPANLLWTEDRRQVKIADFGVSHFSYAQRLASAGSEGIEQDDPYDPILLDDSDLTRRAGTPSFLAPEIIFEHTHDVPLSTSFSSQVHAQSSSASVHTVQPQEKITKPPITKAIDIWALGVTLYCLLFGKTPFVADPGAGITEWSLYNSICNSDWTVADTMGSDQAPTGGRQPKEDDESAAIIHLLDHLLQKDVKARITLDEVKHHPWVLEGLQDPQRWLRITSPVKKIHVSLHETSEAMSTVHFRWNWGALSRRISSILRTVRPRPTRIRDHEHSHNRGAISEPHVAETSTTQHSETRLLMQEPPKRDKGKKKAGEKLNTQSLRSKSIERWPINPHHTQRSSSVIIQGSGRKPRRGSETILDERQEPPASPSHSTDRRARWSLLLSLIVGRRTGKNSAGPSPTETDPIQIRSSPRLPGAALSQGSAANRRSEEALRYYRSGQSMSGRLTAARRASSWGQGDKPNEVAEVVSVVSVGSVERKMNEHSMIVGAGGLHNDTHLHVPRTASSLASSPLREITHPSPLSDEEEEAERLFGLRSYDDSSTVASGRDDYGDPVEHSSEEGEWKTGSDLEDEEDDDDDDDADKEYDSDDQDNVVTFSPRRRTPHQ